MVVRMITSTSNPRIKRLVQLRNKAKYREAEDVFIIEGSRMFLELPKDLVREIYITEEALRKKEIRRYLDELSCPYEVVSGEVFTRISDTVTPQGILAVVKRMKYDLEDIIIGRTPMLLMVEDIQDPGNLGTMFRTAEAAGVNGIIMSRDTVDIYNPKTIRSTMGSVFRVPFIYADSLKNIINDLKHRDISVYAAALHHSLNYTEADYSEGCAILIGNEGSGLRQETLKSASAAVTIPMTGSVESLNAAVSASVILYEAVRQRS